MTPDLLYEFGIDDKNGVPHLLSPVAAALVQKTSARGPFEGFSHYGVSGIPGDGPYVELWFEVVDGAIRAASFRVPGCPSSTAAAAMLCELAKGRAPEKLVELTGPELLLILGGLPEGKEHHAHRTIEAMKAAFPVSEG